MDRRGGVRLAIALVQSYLLEPQDEMAVSDLLKAAGDIEVFVAIEWMSIAVGKLLSEAGHDPTTWLKDYLEEMQ